MLADQMEEFEFSELQSGYATQWNLLGDCFEVLDHRLYLLYKYHQWLGPNNDLKNMLGLVVSREEFEHNLTRAAQTSLEDKLEPGEREQLELMDQALVLRLERTQQSLPLLELMNRFDLDSFQRWCVVLCYACELDQKYQRMLCYLQDDITKKYPTTALVSELFLPQGAAMEQQLAGFDRTSWFLSLFDGEKLEQGELRLGSAALGFISGDTALPAGLELFDGARDQTETPLLIACDVGRRLDVLFAAPGRSAALLVGVQGVGKRFQVRQLMARTGDRCLFADLEALGHQPQAVQTAALYARLYDACLCLYNLDQISAEGDLTEPPAALTAVLSNLDFPREKLFLLARHTVHVPLAVPALELELESPAAQDRLVLLEHFLADVPLAQELSLPELAAKFHFQPSQLDQACKLAKGLVQLEPGSVLDAETMHRCCYRQVVHKLDALASRIRPAHGWEDIVLPEKQKKLMMHACDHIRFQHQVYHGWGFETKISYGKGLSILFAGVPGTGKTMCAQAMAKQLNMEMYKINISQIVSKYIGETEKNLHAVFAEAKNSNCILFFDECDALFGKRSEVKDAHDRNANVEVAYLLQQIEEFDGVCVLATNLVQNIDEAFMRRITYVVHFPFPDAATRKEIYLRTLPKAAPVDEDVDWDFLAQKFELSGGYIKNIVLSAAFSAASENRPICMRHLLTAAVNELRKNEIVVVREELREYADLLDD